MKKATWKRLFTRNKSKNRDQNDVVCNLCGGLPLTDINSLCDSHRNTHSEAPKSPGILKDSKGSAGYKKKFGKREEKQPSVSSPENVAQTEDESTVNPSLIPVEIHEDAESITQKPMINPEKLDRAATNEEFMTEEVDSPSLTENSPLENIEPIVIEPEENPKRESDHEAEQLKKRISFTSFTPTKIFEIPSKEEVKEAMAAAEDHKQIHEEMEKKKYSWVKSQRKNPERNAAVAIANQNWFGTSPGISLENESKMLSPNYDDGEDDEEEEGEGEEDAEEEEGGEIHEINDKPEEKGEGKEQKTKAENTQERARVSEECDIEVETNKEGTHSYEEYTELETHKESSHENKENQELEIHGSGTDVIEQVGEIETNKEDTNERDNIMWSSTNNLPDYSSNSHSVVINPDLSEPTPLSSILPNVFMNAPKVFEFQTSSSVRDSKKDIDNEQKVDSQLSNASENEHIIETAETGGKTYAGGAENSKQDSQDSKAEEDKNADESFEIESDYQDVEFHPEPTKDHNESMTTTTFMELSEKATDPRHPVPSPPEQELTPAVSDKPVPRSDDHISAVTTSLPPPVSEEPIPQNDHNSTGHQMVFGTITTDFSNQPLFFSPNFGAQRMVPNVDRSAPRNNPGLEPQFPHYNIYDVMKNFMKTLEPSEEDVGRVTEVYDSESSGIQNPKQQQPGQSPPSLEIEEEFEPNRETKKEPEEQKKLKKE